MIPEDVLLISDVNAHVFVAEFHVPIYWQSPPVASSVIVYGAPGSGGVVSVWLYSKVTVKFAVPIFPAASDAVQVTVVIPTGKNEPDVGVHVGVTGWEYVPEEFVTASVAVGRL